VPSAVWTDLWQRIVERARLYLSVEQNRRDAQSMAASLVSFFIFLWIAAGGFMPSYLFIDRPGRAITVKFEAARETAFAEIAQTRLQTAAGRPRPSTVQPPKSNRPFPSTLRSMAAGRPDYFGRLPLQPPSDKNRPVMPDAPVQWQEHRTTSEPATNRPVYGSGPVDLPSPRIGTPTGQGPPTSEVTFDVPVSGGAKGGADFISLSGSSRPSSIGQPGGKELSTRRPIKHKPLPTIPEWFERKGLDSIVTFRVVVAASGRVESADVEQTSGFKDIDAEARAHVLQWVFEPTGFRETIIVKLNYRLR